MVISHGQSFITTDENIMTIKSIGAFNLEGITTGITQ